MIIPERAPVDWCFLIVTDICLQLQKAENELQNVRREWHSSVQSCKGLEEALKT